MTLDTVYAVHSFEAENEDEVPFRVGEPILVLEKDDLYGDSWWKGKNIHGQIGLFPMTYISYERPRSDSPVNVPSLSTSNDSARENLQPATPTSALNMHGSDLDLPLPSFRMPSPSIDETIDDIQDKLQRMAVRTEEEQVYQNKINQQQRPWTPKNGYSSKLFMASSSGSSTTSSRMSSTGKQQSSPHSPFETVDSTKKVEIPSTSTNDKQQNRHPVSWDVNQVCAWLTEKGFESEMHHFVDNDITGDVLVGLSISTLLKELNISSFGKRVHIMNAITELKSQFSIGNENDDISDEEYHHAQSTSLYSEQHLQNSLYSSQAMMNSNLNLHQYGAISNISLPHINGGLAYPRQMIDNPRTSTPNLAAKNFPPTYYTYSQRIDDAEGANIEMILPKSTNKKDKILSKLNFAKRNINYKKDRTRSTGGWDFNKDRNSMAGIPKRSLDLEKINQRTNPSSSGSRNNNYYFENVDENGDFSEEVLKSIEEPDHSGWLRKQGDKYKSWKSRYCVLKGSNLYYFKSDKETDPSNVKGFINLSGYRIIPDENILHGKYGFKLIHDSERSHYFAHEDADKLKGWMKAMIKSTIARDSKAPVISSSNIPTVPLSEARKLTPRPPDPRRPPASPAAFNIITSPILRPISPLSQRAGSPVPTRPLSPALQTIHNNTSSPLIRPLNTNRSTIEFF